MAVVGANDQVVFAGMLDDVWKIIAGLAADVEPALSQQCLLIQFPALKVVALGEIGEDIGEPTAR